MLPTELVCIISCKTLEQGDETLTSFNNRQPELQARSKNRGNRK